MDSKGLSKNRFSNRASEWLTKSHIPCGHSNYSIKNAAHHIFNRKRKNHHRMSTTKAIDSPTESTMTTPLEKRKLPANKKKENCNECCHDSIGNKLRNYCFRFIKLSFRQNEKCERDKRWGKWKGKNQEEAMTRPTSKHSQFSM